MFERHSVTLAAGGAWTLWSYNRYFILESVVGSTTVQVGIGELSLTDWPVGLTYELPQGREYNKIRFFNTAAVPVTITSLLSLERIELTRDTQINTTALAIQALLTPSTGTALVPVTLAAIGAPPATLVLAANTNRLDGDLEADPANTDYIYLGFTNAVGAALWSAKLGPGGSWKIKGVTSAIYGAGAIAGQIVSGWSR